MSGFHLRPVDNAWENSRQLCKPQTVGCLENDDLEYDDLESKDLENDDLENLELQGRTGMGWLEEY